MKFQVDLDKLFPALYIVNLGNTAKLSMVSVRRFPLCEFFSLCFLNRKHVYVYICFYITMCDITKFIVFSVFRHQNIVSKVCRVHKRNASWPSCYFISNYFCALFIYVYNQMRDCHLFAYLYQISLPFSSSSTYAVLCVKLFLVWDIHPMKP